MTLKEINKKAYEKYPIKMIPDDDTMGFTSTDVNEAARNGYIEAYKEISLLPTIKGWVVREESTEIKHSGESRIMEGRLLFFKDKPTRGKFGCLNGGNVMLSSPFFHDFFDMFSKLKSKDEPIEVELSIIIKKEK